MKPLVFLVSLFLSSFWVGEVFALGIDSLAESSDLAIERVSPEIAPQKMDFLPQTPKLEAKSSIYSPQGLKDDAKTSEIEGITLQRTPVKSPQVKTPLQNSQSQILAQNIPTTQPAPRILAPIPDTLLDIPSATVTIQFPVGTKVELRAGGKIVSESSIGKVEEDSLNQTITQTFFGVTLNQGETLIELYRQGESTPIATSKVVVRGSINSIQVQTLETRIPANGSSTATIQGQLLDDKGNRSNRSAIITLNASQGEFVGQDAKPDIDGWQVEAVDGKFTATLKSNLTSGNVTIRAATIIDNKKLEAFTQILFETNLRPSIVTGVIDLRLGARGTDYYSSFRDFLPVDGNYDTQARLYAAIFGTGQIGEWLFSGAYNSQRTLNETCAGQQSVFRTTQDCDQNYPVYGDNSQVTNITPSYNSLFLRLERTSPVPNAGIDYFMWGDFRTEEFANPAQEYTALNRTLNGFKFNYNVGDLQLTGFYNVLGRGFQRDAIAPDGTSGFYFLSRRGLISGSETIAIETVEVLNPSNVISREQLQRGSDYEIDYARGSLLFRNGISQTTVSSTGAVLRRLIVAVYEYENGKDTNSYAGQARYSFNRIQGMESWLGVTYFRENQSSRNFTIYGVNTQIYFNKDIKLVSEYGRSESLSPEYGFVSGSAMRQELNAKINETIIARAFYRTADPGFNNNATLSFTPGQTRFGVTVNARLSNETSFRAEIEREQNRGIAPTPTNNFDSFTTITPGTPLDNDFTSITLGVEQKLGAALLSLDYIYRDRVDRIGTLNSNSSQLRSRLITPLADNLRLTLLNETTISGTGDAVYNDRTSLELTWQIAQGINFALGQQWFRSGQLAGQTLTTAELTGDYNLSQDTTATGRFSVFSSGENYSTQGALGIKQRWVVTEGLKLNLAYERVFGAPLVLGTGLQFTQPVAVGQTASSLPLQGGDNYRASLEYTPNPDFKADLKFEQRNSSTGTNTVLSGNAIGKLSPSLWAITSYQQANIANQGFTGLGNTVNFKVGLAYRPADDDSFNALLRYEYRQNPSSIPDTVLLGSGTGYEDHTFALEAIYAPSWQWEFYGKFALRNTTTYIASDLAGNGSISLSQLRATYRLNSQFDLTGEARLIVQPTAGYTETGFVAELGYWMSPNLRLAVGYSSGAVNSDRDFSGSRSAGGLYLGVTLRIDELFNNFGLQRPVPATTPPPITDTNSNPNIQAKAETLRWTVSQQVGDTGSNLSNSDRLVLDNLVVVLQSSPQITVDIQSSISISDIQNKVNPLSQRLLAVRNYLLQRGISGQQIILRSLGTNINNDSKISFVVSGNPNTFRTIVSNLQAQPNSPASQFFQNLLSQLPADPIISKSAAINAPNDPRRVSQAIELTADGRIADRSQTILDQLVASALKQPDTDIEIEGDINRTVAIRRYLLGKGINSDRILFVGSDRPNNTQIILSLTPPATTVATTPKPLPKLSVLSTTSTEATYQSLTQWQTQPVDLSLLESESTFALLPDKLLYRQNILPSLGTNISNDSKISFVVSGNPNTFRTIVSNLQAQPNSPTSQFFQNLLSQLPATAVPIISKSAAINTPNDPRRVSQAIEIAPDGKILERSQAILNQLIGTALQQSNSDIELTGDLNRNLAIRRYLIDKGISSDRILFSNTENANNLTNAVILSLAPSAPVENIATIPPVQPPSLSRQLTPEPIYQSLIDWNTSPLSLRLQENFNPLALLPPELISPENIVIGANTQLLSMLIPDDRPTILANAIDNVPFDLRLTTALNFLLNNNSDPLAALKEAIGIGSNLQGQVIESINFSKDSSKGGT